MEWMIMPFKRYADFSGRSRRMEYWMFHLFVYFVLLVGFIGAFVLDDLTNGDSRGEPGPIATAGMVLMGLFFVGSIIPMISVTVRRFHDQDKSGWMYLLGFIPYVGGLVLFVFMCLEGTHGENQYGPDPKNPGYDPGVFS